LTSGINRRPERIAVALVKVSKAVNGQPAFGYLLRQWVTSPWRHSGPPIFLHGIVQRIDALEILHESTLV
jgi:hypothetical protein